MKYIKLEDMHKYNIPKTNAIRRKFKKLIDNGIRTRFVTICKYFKNPNVDRAKGLLFPELRGTWIPSFDIQSDFGIAINWFGVRVRMSLGRRYFNKGVN